MFTCVVICALYRVVDNGNFSCIFPTLWSLCTRQKVAQVRVCARACACPKDNLQSLTSIILFCISVVYLSFVLIVRSLL